NWHFWMIQGLVISIAVMHSVFEAPGLLHDLGLPYFIPTTLFLIPVVYAAMTFGFSGALATALLATALSAHNWILFHEEPIERFGCMFQMLTVNAVAFFVGKQADRQKSTWRRAEATTNELKASRSRYRGLFESSPLAVLVLDSSSVILEANPAASILFDRNKVALEGMPIADLLGPDGEQKLLHSFSNSRWRDDSLTVTLKDGLKLYLEPTFSEINDDQGNMVTQVLFRNITEEHGRQIGLRTYAAYVIRVQEEERQRISRELHDETIQSLVLLCRRLDSAWDESESLPQAQRDRLMESKKIAEEAINGLRDFTKTLRPPILDDLGMVTSIRRMITDLTERDKIKGQLKIVGKERRLPSEIELGLFRITQEAFRNVEKHSGATRVVATITFGPNEVRLEIVDNGAGFSPSTVSDDFIVSGQLGLISMQERAGLLGGRLDIQSGSGEGTRVTVSIPVTDGIPEVPAHRPD
ncbi:MAG: PAS domain-containing sensor histidine kinase, partial [Dehalococcoidales bacterium]